MYLACEHFLPDPGLAEQQDVDAALRHPVDQAVELLHRVVAHDVRRGLQSLAGGRRVAVFIDEFDRLASNDDRLLFADTIKTLSDELPGATIPSGTAGTIPGADLVIAGLRPSFRRCYNVGLAAEPSMSGKTVLVARVGPAGEVLDASAEDTAGLSDGVVACLVNVLKDARFEAPGRTLVLRAPVSYVRK